MNLTPSFECQEVQSSAETCLYQIGEYYGKRGIATTSFVLSQGTHQVALASTLFF